MITRMALEKIILYRIRIYMKNLLLGLHATVNKLVMITEIEFSALQKMVRWWMMCVVSEQQAKYLEEKIPLEAVTRKFSYWL